MIVNAPSPAAAPAPAAPAAPPAAAGAAPKVDDVPVAAPTGPAADGAKQQTPPPAAGGGAPADAAAAKAAILEKIQQTSAADAIAQVDAHLTKLAGMSVGGATPDGANSAQAASALLTDSSMLLQHAHVKAMEHLRNMATELHLRVMNSVSGLAYMGGQVAIAGQSKDPVKLAEIAAGPIAETKATMADVIAAIAPKGDAPAAEAPKVEAPKAEAPKPDAASVPVPSAPNGNTGVAGGVVPPKGLQHVTPGPGAGRGPNPA